MIGALGALAQPILRRIDPEAAHRAAILALKYLPSALPRPRAAALAVDVCGLTFPNPLGLAAGFDKNAEAAQGLLNAGFGFVEVGTLTPRPQLGNARPRLFRLDEDAAVINRMGFNNCGYEEAAARLASKRPAGILGVNVGPNKDSSDRAADYLAGVARFAEVASYFTINVSSPNTAGLRDLQQKTALDSLLARVVEARDRHQPRRPVLLKIASDVSLAELDDIVSVARARRLDGMLISNTTTERPATLRSRNASESGGLSGAPLFSRSTQCLAQAYLRSDGAFALIGCGGVDSAQTMVAKMEAGASLVQIYTALVFRGPALINAILDGLAQTLSRRGLASVAGLTGATARDVVRS